jgi:hypothetical protein
MRAYSMDLRQRVAATVDEGRWSQRQVARLFRVSLSFVSRLLKRRREAGTLSPEPHRGGPRWTSPSGGGCAGWPGSTTTTRWRSRGGAAASAVA